MRVVIDIEANALINPINIWLIVCKDIDNNQMYFFRNVTQDKDQADAFLIFAKEVKLWIGHNLLGYDLPVLNSLLGLDVHALLPNCIDTLIVSKLVNYSQEDGHSLKSYGQRLNLEKQEFSDWTKYSQQMEDYCVRDVDICEAVYHRYSSVLNNPDYAVSINLEHQFQLVVNRLGNNGFCFDVVRAKSLLDRVERELKELDKAIERQFPPRLKLLKEIHPTRTKYGTLNKKDFRWVSDGDLSEFNGGPFCRLHSVCFNPNSHKQLIEVLNEARWKPLEKTKTHIDLERTIHRIKKEKRVDIDLKEYYNDLERMRRTGYRINENNLASLPDDAPAPARTLARRILLESRRRTLTEWLGLLSPDNRIHGTFYGIGAWTHRMAHQRPNTANIPTTKKLYGSDMRSLWCAPPGKVLVGVDAKGIQLRIFAHYIDDKEFTKELLNGDPHSLNKRILGDICQTRDAAKRFIYALLLGAGVNKLSEILESNSEKTREALSRLLSRYPGFAYLKETIIPKDARKGWFTGLDGRRVPIPGQTQSERSHLCMSGYLQNGEAIIMKRACLKWADTFTSRITSRFLGHHFDWKIVNFVHDEWVLEAPDDLSIAEEIKNIVCQSIADTGEELKLRCPMAGEGRIGINWSTIH